MISQLHIENFRSIEKATFDFGRITLLTGSNNSGKSSVMYALLTLKCLAENPYRPLNNIFNIPDVINMGDFSDVVFGNSFHKSVKFDITLENEDVKLISGIAINQFSVLDTNLQILQPFQYSGSLQLSLPCLLSKEIEVIDKYRFNGFFIIDPTLRQNHTEWYSKQPLNKFGKTLAFIPTRRGFSKLVFYQSPFREFQYSENEIATEIYAYKLQSDISHYLEKIAERSFEISKLPDTGILYLKTRDIKTGFSNNLVNEGTGTNQLVMILARALLPESKFICIDEPEIHLHPSMIEKLVEALVEIAYKQDKQFLLSTHSEHFVTCLLSEVVKKNLQPDDLKVYYLTKEQQTTKVEHQAVNADGQIEGGLKNFYESELKNLETFFKIT